MAQRQPDLIVAIDFGMTCTGVAYNTTYSGSDNIRWIQKWPGRMQANENKVPSILVYPHGQQFPSSWGFLSETIVEQTAEDRDHREWFKVFLDEEKLRQAQSAAQDPKDVPSSMTEVEKWYTDYLRSLYQYIRNKLTIEVMTIWEDAAVEFVFSVPTTWNNVTVERFKAIISDAGYGRAPKHSVSIGLTEAEAAAVHMAKEAPAIFKDGEILLVCDVGGGTTDLSVLRVRHSNNGALELEQLDVVFGANLGSAQIDRGFENYLLEKLEFGNKYLPMKFNIEDAAWEMMKSREYQNAKCDFGSPDDTPIFSVAVPKLDRHYQNDYVGIVDGDMRIPIHDLRRLFDIQVNRLYDLIDKQLNRLREKFPTETVSHLVLSGGLGNSAYVQDCVRARYAPGLASWSNAAQIQVRVAPDPQLVVCKGLVADRLAKIHTGKTILSWRCCRESYGITAKELYDVANPHHHGLKTQLDPMDGRTYVHIVEWMIKKGHPVSIDSPISQGFQRKISPINPKAVFPCTIVRSNADPDRLPYAFNHQCSVLCTVQSDLTSVDVRQFKLKNRHWWNHGPKFYRVRYDVKVLLGSADITYELWFKGEKLSQDNPIKVEWEASAPPPAPIPTEHMQLETFNTQQNWGVSQIGKTRKTNTRSSVGMASSNQGGIYTQTNGYARTGLMALRSMGMPGRAQKAESD